MHKNNVMIEDEIRQEIQEERAEIIEEPCLFPKKEWDELKIHWQPVSNISTDEIYKDLPEVKEFHDNYTQLWLKEKSR